MLLTYTCKQFKRKKHVLCSCQQLKKNIKIKQPIKKLDKIIKSKKQKVYTRK